MRWTVVVEGIPLEPPPKPRHGVRIACFRAEVVHLVICGVPRLQEALDVLDAITVHLLVVDGRDAHGDDARRHVGQIEVKTVLSRAMLLLRDEGPDFILEELGHGGAASL